MTSYPKLYRRVLLPFYESFLRRRKTLQYFEQLETNQWRSEPEIRAWQWQELRQLLEHAYAHVPFYAGAFRDRGLTPADIREPADLQKLPVIDRSTVKAQGDRMRADNVPEILSKSTGGSTGEPLRFGYTRASYEWRTAVRMRGYAWAGYEEGDRAAYLWGVPIGEVSVAASLKINVHHWFQNARYFTVFDLAPATMARYFRQMQRYRPKHLLAFGLAMYHFARYIRDQGWTPFPLASIILGAEKPDPEQIQFIESVFQCPVFMTYGCREFMLIASQCERRRDLHVHADNLFVEILRGDSPAAAGQPGEVVITDLHNYGMPFVRYRNGDLAIPAAGTCPCGRGLPLIADVVGRTADLIVTVDGRIVTGLFFPHLMKDFPEVDRFQVIQETREALRIRLLPNREISPERLDGIRAAIRKVCGANMEIQLEIVTEIPLTPSGKHRVAISKVPLPF